MAAALDIDRSIPPKVPVRFTVDEAQKASDEWGMNCGPGAVAGVLGKTLDEIRPRLLDFEHKRYTNPTLMLAILNNLGVRWTKVKSVWPWRIGLVRVQWEGPWTRDGVPIRARYRHTHWIGARRVGTNAWDMEIFDINAICVGGWIPLREWNEQLVPWLLRECEKRAYGTWHQTHVIELQ